jgi:hypothetical protein
MFDIGFFELVVLRQSWRLVRESAPSGAAEGRAQCARVISSAVCSANVTDVKSDITAEIELDEAAQGCRRRCRPAASDLMSSVEIPPARGSRRRVPGVRDVEQRPQRGRSPTTSDTTAPDGPARRMEPAPLPNEPGGRSLRRDAAPADLPRQPTLPGIRQDMSAPGAQVSKAAETRRSRQAPKGARPRRASVRGRHVPYSQAVKTRRNEATSRERRIHPEARSSAEG